jgi:hypothetical protein
MLRKISGLCNSVMWVHSLHRQHTQCLQEATATAAGVTLGHVPDSPKPAREILEKCPVGVKPCPARRYRDGTLVGASGTDGPFSKIAYRPIFLLSSSGGGLPGRPETRKSPDACLIFSSVLSSQEIPDGRPNAGTYPSILPDPEHGSASPFRLPVCSCPVSSLICCRAHTA